MLMIPYIEYIFIASLVVIVNVGYVRLLFLKKQQRWVIYLPYALFFNAVGLGATRRLFLRFFNSEIYGDISIYLLMMNICFFIVGYILVKRIKKQNNIKYLKEWFDKAGDGIQISNKTKSFTSILYVGSCFTNLGLIVLFVVN